MEYKLNYIIEYKAQETFSINYCRNGEIMELLLSLSFSFFFLFSFFFWFFGLEKAFWGSKIFCFSFSLFDYHLLQKSSLKCFIRCIMCWDVLNLDPNMFLSVTYCFGTFPEFKTSGARWIEYPRFFVLIQFYFFTRISWGVFLSMY